MALGKKIGVVFLIFTLLSLVGLYFVYQSLFKSSTVAAQLHVESGDVNVDNVKVDGNVKLKRGSVIETLSSGLATVILYESTLISLSENTKVKVDDLILKHPKVSQEKGKTWNKFTKVVGSEDYSIKAGNTVASVRGTGFLLTDSKVVTGEGSVDYEADGKSFVVEKYKAVEKKDGEIVERSATKDELNEISRSIERTINELKYLRQLEIDKKKFLLDQMRKMYTIRDDQIQEALDTADKGLVDIDELMKQYKNKIPAGISLETLDKVVAITKEIQKLNQDLDEIKDKS